MVEWLTIWSELAVSYGRATPLSIEQRDKEMEFLNKHLVAGVTRVESKQLLKVRAGLAAHQPAIAPGWAMLLPARER
jgi:hypothetical protein